MSVKRGGILRTALGVAAASWLLYAVVDAGYGLLRPPRPYDGYRERLVAPAYAGEPYFSEAFLAESFTQPGGWTTPAGTRLVLPNEFHGRFFNVDLLEPTGLPYRRTVAPEGAAGGRVVLLLGGSTIYDSEVPDGLTVASRLAAILDGAGGGAYTVVNAGVTSANTTQELERLEAELQRGLRPEVVISFSGVNDALQGVYFGDPDGVMFSEATRPKGDPPAAGGLRAFVRSAAPPWCLAACRGLARFLWPTRIYRALAQRSRSLRPRLTPAHLADARRVADLAARTAARYEENLLRMQRLGELHGFRFLALLQPQLYSGQGYRERADVDFVTRHDALRLPLVGAAFVAAYGELRGAIARLGQGRVRATDLTGLFDGKTENVFLDSHHVNARGNQRIAQAIAGALAAAAP